MTVELLQNLSLAAYLAGGVFLGIAVLLFFVFHVPQIVGDLSGTTARRAIESIEQQNSDGNGRKSRRARRERESFSTERFRTGHLRPQKQTSAADADTAPETTVLAQGAVTPETTVLAQSVITPETTVLAQNAVTSETTVHTQYVPEPVIPAQNMTVDVEFGFAESAETID